MEKSEIMNMVLDRLVDEMDEVEGNSSMAHSQEECPDPLGCTMHDGEHGDNLSEGKPSGVEVEIKKLGEGMPSMEGAKEDAAEDGLSDDDAEELRKLLK